MQRYEITYEMKMGRKIREVFIRNIPDYCKIHDLNFSVILKKEAFWWFQKDTVSITLTGAKEDLDQAYMDLRDIFEWNV